MLRVNSAVGFNEMRYTCLPDYAVYNILNTKTSLLCLLCDVIHDKTSAIFNLGGQC